MDPENIAQDSAAVHDQTDQPSRTDTARGTRVKKKRVHNSYKCDHCGKAFRQKRRFVAHRRIHAGSVAVPHRSGQPSHMDSVKEIRAQKCLVCGYTTSRRTDMRDHLRIHTGERPFKCGHCSKAFRVKSYLVTHQRVHAESVQHGRGRPPNLDSCNGKRVRGHTPRRRSNLNDHLKTHTAERPYICDYCDKGFKQMAHLKEHLRIHTGERPYKCHLCPMDFKQSSSLTRHLETHTREMLSNDGDGVASVPQWSATGPLEQQKGHE